jgi:hypothetical protein
VTPDLSGEALIRAHEAGEHGDGEALGSTGECFLCREHWLETHAEEFLERAERAEAERDALLEEKADPKHAYQQLHDELDRQEMAILNLEAERDRLREAVQTASDMINSDPRYTMEFGPGSPSIPVLGILRNALAALEGEK